MVYKGSPRRPGFQAGLLICHGSGKRRLTGDELGPDLKGGEPDYLGAPNWEVLPADDPLAERFDMESEAILMLWEDGAAVIFLSDDEYHWRWVDPL